MAAQAVVVGIDVSQAKLDIAVLPSGTQFTVAHDRAGIAQLWPRLKPLVPTEVVREATGQLEGLAVSDLAGAGVPVVVVNPGRVRHYAKARGQRAKTDPSDARLIAEFAQELKPEFHALPAADTQQLAALCQRRRPLLAMQQMENNRVARSQPAIRQSIQSRQRFLPRQLEQVEQEIERRIKNSPIWQAKRALRASMQGMGATSCTTWLAWLPELGQFSRQRICALVGVAPYDDDSGQRHGRRQLAGGRAAVRRVLYMATLAAVRHNPDLKVYYQRLLERGVEPKSALIAARRKMLTMLNAMVRDNAQWRSLCAKPA